MYMHLSAVDAIVNVLRDHVCPVTSCPANHASVDRTSGQIVAVYGAANNGGCCDREGDRYTESRGCHDLKPVEYWNAGAADVFSTASVCPVK